MKNYSAENLLSIAYNLILIQMEAVPESSIKNLRKATENGLSSIINKVELMNLKITLIFAKRFLKEISFLKHNEIKEKNLLLQEILIEELKEISFFFISQDKLEYYQSPNLFRDNVAAKFPTANYEVSEAGKCFAVGRYTATVFHLMRALEVALKALYKELKIPDITKDGERNWGSILKKIKDEIHNRNQSSDPVLKEDLSFFEKAYAYFEGVRNPWRNSTMHVESNYDEEGAQDVFNATSTLMRHLSTRLSE